MVSHSSPTNVKQKEAKWLIIRSIGGQLTWKGIDKNKKPSYFRLKCLNTPKTGLFAKVGGPLLSSGKRYSATSRVGYPEVKEDIPYNFEKLVFVNAPVHIVKGLWELPVYHVYLSSVADTDLGSGIRDPVPFWSLEPSTGIGFSLIPDAKRFSGIQKSGTEYSGLWNK